MVAGYTITGNNYYGSKPIEILVGNYHYLNEVSLYYYSKQQIIDDKNIIGRWKIKYK